MKTFKETLRDLLELTSKDDMAEKLYNILDNYKSSIAVRLEREYTFTDFDTKEFVASDCFVQPPIKGEFYVAKNGIYEVLQVIHVADSRQAGTIHVRRQREFKKTDVSNIEEF